MSGDDNSYGDEIEDEEEEEEAPLVQHPPQGGQPAHSIHFGILEVHHTQVPSYVTRVNYKAKGMTERVESRGGLILGVYQRVAHMIIGFALCFSLIIILV